MPDTDSRYIITYGVWIPGLGWLKKNNRVFTDPRREVAESAAWLWGGGAFVIPNDMNDRGVSALVDLESEFLEREAERKAKKLVNRARVSIGRLSYKLSTWIRVILRRPRGIMSTESTWLCSRCGHINNKNKCIICGLSRR